MAAIYARTRRALIVANQRQKQFADAGRRGVEYNVGNEVLLSTKNINLRIPRGGTGKLMPIYIGLFRNLERFAPLLIS